MAPPLIRKLPPSPPTPVSGKFCTVTPISDTALGVDVVKPGDPALTAIPRLSPPVPSTVMFSMFTTDEKTWMLPLISPPLTSC